MTNEEMEKFSKLADDLTAAKIELTTTKQTLTDYTNQVQNLTKEVDMSKQKYEKLMETNKALFEKVYIEKVPDVIKSATVEQKKEINDPKEKLTEFLKLL